jgi:hypothetical protein
MPMLPDVAVLALTSILSYGDVTTANIIPVSVSDPVACQTQAYANNAHRLSFGDVAKSAGVPVVAQSWGCINGDYLKIALTGVMPPEFSGGGDADAPTQMELDSGE